MTFGEKLAKARRENNYTQEELADLLNVSRQSVSKWESDLGFPETDRLIKIGELFDCSIDYLLKDSVTDETHPYDDTETNTSESKEKRIKKKRTGKIISAISGSAAITITAVYLILGFVCDAWHPAWLLFMLLPVVSSLGVAMAKRKATLFAYPILVVAVYLALGFLLDWWHPAWIVFFTIPVYYIIAEAVGR